MDEGSIERKGIWEDRRVRRRSKVRKVLRRVKYIKGV
jgi:hypothetical protein